MESVGVSGMIKVQKRCQHIKEDGHKCNVMYIGNTKPGSTLKCKEHMYVRGATASYKEQAGLIRSTNVYAKAGNDEKMRDFVYKMMAAYDGDKKHIAELQKATESLGNRLTYLESNAEQAVENLKLLNSIKKLERQNGVNEKKIESMRKMIHRMKKALGI